jgi:hypothetical protein
MATSNGFQLLSDVAKALGLERVKSIDIYLSVDEQPTVSVVQLVAEDDGQRLVEVLTRYQLQPVALQPDKLPS